MSCSITVHLYDWRLFYSTMGTGNYFTPQQQWWFLTKPTLHYVDVYQKPTLHYCSYTYPQQWVTYVKAQRWVIYLQTPMMGQLHAYTCLHTHVCTGLRLEFRVRVSVARNYIDRGVYRVKVLGLVYISLLHFLGLKC